MNYLDHISIPRWIPIILRMQPLGGFLREKIDSLQRFVVPKKFQRKIYTILDWALYRLHQKYRISNEKLLLIAELWWDESDTADLCKDWTILETLISSKLMDLKRIMALYKINQPNELKELLSRKDISYFLQVYWRTGCMGEILSIPGITTDNFEEICHRRGTSDILFYWKSDTLQRNIEYTSKRGYNPVDLLLWEFPHLFATKAELFHELLPEIINPQVFERYSIQDRTEDISIKESDFDSNNCQYSEIAHAKVLFWWKDAHRIFLKGELIGHIKRIWDPTFLSYVDCWILKRWYIYFVHWSEIFEGLDIDLGRLKVMPMRQLSFSDAELDLGISRMIKKHSIITKSDIEP